MNRFYVDGIDETGQHKTVGSEGDTPAQAKQLTVTLRILKEASAARPAPDCRPTYVLDTYNPDGEPRRVSVQASSVKSAIVKITNANFKPLRLVEIVLPVESKKTPPPIRLENSPSAGPTMPGPEDEALVEAQRRSAPPPQPHADNRFNVDESGEEWFVDGIDPSGRPRTIRVFGLDRETVMRNPKVHALRAVSSIRPVIAPPPPPNPLLDLVQAIYSFREVVLRRGDAAALHLELYPDDLARAVRSMGNSRVIEVCACAWWLQNFAKVAGASGVNGFTKPSLIALQEPLLDPIAKIMGISISDDVLGKWSESEDFEGGLYPAWDDRLRLIKDFCSSTGNGIDDEFIRISGQLVKIVVEADGRITRSEQTVIDDMDGCLRDYFSNHVVKTTTIRKSEPTVAVDGEQAKREKAIAEVMDEMDDLIGIDDVKLEIKKLEALLKMAAQRKAQKLPMPKMSLHYVFHGNPGTGKTTVARILGKLMFGYGVLNKGHVIETDRSGLVASYLGQTATKTDSVIESATDGILFIDEAYTLSRGTSDGDSYGQEAIDTLLKRMEDRRDRMVVVVAGYPAEMSTFVSSNPGLKSRFTKFMSFPDYTAEDLSEIFARIVKREKFKLNKDAKEALKNKIATLISARDKSFGNAREMRNLFETAVGNQAIRLSELGRDATKDELKTIEPSDILSAM